MKAVIVAGGKGTRLKNYTNEIPKPLIKVLGIPLLERQLINLRNNGVKEFIIIIGYLGDKIREYFGDGDKLNIKITYIVEEEPLGSAGSLFYLKNKLHDNFLLIFADLVFDIDIDKMEQFHKDKCALITLFAHPNSHPFDSDLLEINKNCCVKHIFSKKHHRKNWSHNIVNAGVFVISPRALSFFKKPKMIDMENDFVKSLIPTNRVFAYQSSEYIKDMGTPDRLKQVESDIKAGIVANKNLRLAQKCIFLDRDGTINKYCGFLSNINEFELIPGVCEAIKRINTSEYLSIVITNQPIVSHGKLTLKQLDEIHKKMETMLGAGGAYINDLFFCPHYPKRGFKGEIKKYKIRCNCRKPKIGLLLQAKQKFNIDLKQSWFVGDSDLDVKCGKNARCKTILLCNKSNKNSQADYFAKDLLEAINIILKIKQNRV